MNSKIRFVVIFAIILIFTFLSCSSVFADSTKSPFDLVDMSVSELPFDTSTPWCVRFARWVSEICYDVDSNDLSPSDSCMWSIRWLSQRNQFKSNNPMIGDWVFFDWENDGLSDHVGVIVGIDLCNNLLSVIEGNVNDRIYLRRIALDDCRIFGFGSCSPFNSVRSPHSSISPAYSSGASVNVVSPVAPSETSGFKGVLLDLIGNYDTIVTEHRYTNSNGYTSVTVDIQPDYVWWASVAILVIVIYSFFRLIGGLIRG